jgi:muramoyltetrapeptide carboxypeptidase
MDKIKPKAIKPGSRIGLIAPAGPVTSEILQQTVSKIESLGFNVSFNPCILDKKGYLAGEDQVRLDDFHQAFSNPDIDAVLCIRGGNGSNRIVNKIDFNLIKKNPKIFVGYSDITVFLTAIWQNAGMVGFHGVVGTSDFTDYTRKNFLEILSCKDSSYEIHPFDTKSIEIITKGKATGELIGGNLCLITTLLSTPYEPDFTDKLVFLEDIDEPPHKIDRMLTQLLLAGKLQNAAGLLLGDFTGGNDAAYNEQHNTLTIGEVLNERLNRLKIPVIKGFSFGHIPNQAIFPVGVKAEIDTAIPFVKLLEAPVQ